VVEKGNANQRAAGEQHDQLVIAKESQEQDSFALVLMPRDRGQHSRDHRCGDHRRHRVADAARQPHRAEVPAPPIEELEGRGIVGGDDRFLEEENPQEHRGEEDPHRNVQQQAAEAGRHEQEHQHPVLAPGPVADSPPDGLSKQTDEGTDGQKNADAAGL
jgi:hypothetical protein